MAPAPFCDAPRPADPHSEQSEVMVAESLQLVDRPDAGRTEEVLGALFRHAAEQSARFEEEPQVQSYLGEVVMEEARRLGLEPRRGAMGSITVTIGPGGRDRRVGLYAYAMTHPAGRMPEPYGGQVLTDASGRRRLRGRGAAEQKGALAAALLAMAALRDRAEELHGSVELCISPAGETGRHDAVRAYLAEAGEPQPAWTIVAIGTNSEICVANKGRVDATVTVRGRSSHSGTPWVGLNAIDGARQVLDRITELSLAGEHPQLGRATLTPTAIHSFPPATHTVPDEVRIVLDRRLLPGDLPEPALEQLRAAIEGLDPYRVKLEPGAFMYPSELAADAPLVRLLDATYRALGHPTRLRYSHGAIDAGYFNQHGIPAVMLGPGEQELWHTDDESVAVDEVRLCAAAYATAALNELAGRP